MHPFSVWLILVMLLASSASFVKPAHAQGFTISLSTSVINTPMSTVVTDLVTVTDTDGTDHTINLRLAAGGTYWWRASFSSNQVVISAASPVATSTMTIWVPSPNEICPGSLGVPYVTFTVKGTDIISGLSASTSLIVNLMPVMLPLTVSIEPSKSSFRIGETVTLTMNSNLPAEYYLKVKEPDGSVWATAHAYLPATFTKTAAEPLGTYTAELVAYYCGVAQASATFSVTPNAYDVTISLAGLPTNVATALRVDGNKVADMKGGDVRVLSYPIDTSHTFAVDQYVNGTTGYRYYSTLNSWTTSSEGSNTFNYATQVYLDVSTEPEGITDVTPPGWYAAGSSASIAQVPTEVKGAEGTKYVFKEWTVDGSSKTSNGFALVMDAPHKVIAKYDTMFLLSVVSDYGNPQGQGYYKAGETATFSVDSPVGMGIQHVFVEWKGDYTGKDPHGSVTMDGPKQVTAVWTTSYTQLLMIAGAILAVVVIAALLLWSRRRTRPAAVKPPPAPPEASTETPVPSAETPPTPQLEATSKRSVALRCTNCGYELNEGQIYCPECGQKQTH